eukprot:TRINITY_DN2822_c0_g1_i1.p1 TRINITY_DN2822_c0_g1~~TRINITY_DN2822_c0_g1_i1.p1  ORF type:complete len:142 (+),score=11.21 TRINITY_DN2822_c0_g1_i1:84-509(+)
MQNLISRYWAPYGKSLPLASTTSLWTRRLTTQPTKTEPFKASETKKPITVKFNVLMTILLVGGLVGALGYHQFKIERNIKLEAKREKEQREKEQRELDEIMGNKAPTTSQKLKESVDDMFDFMMGEDASKSAGKKAKPSSQ